MRPRRFSRVGLYALLATGLLALSPAVNAAASAATPVPGGGPTVLPSFSGHAVPALPVPPHLPAQDPFMAPNPFNNVHDDSWMSDTYPSAGPLGRSPSAWSSTLPAAQSPNSPISLCVGITFDRHGRLETVCAGQGGTSTLLLIDPKSLATLASYALPPSPSQFGAAYFYLDDQDRAVVATAQNHIAVIAQTGPEHQPSFRLADDYDLSGDVGTDHIASVLPDWAGRIWFLTETSGIVGVLDRTTGNAHTHTLNEQIANSFAMTRTGAYIVTTKAMYRLWAGADGLPRVVWSAPYQNIGTTKRGQLSPGSGTTPTILGDGKYVAIADNADQMHVVVYRTDAHLERWQRRTVCETPVFPEGAGATENSLIGSGRSLIVENNYGYTVDLTTLKTTPSEPGIARVDINPSGSGCRLVWNNTATVVPSLVSKMSTKTGLVYTYTKKTDPVTSVDVWYWTAVDFRTGRTVWEKQAGTGGLYNNHYSGLAIGHRGTLYVGVAGGIAALKDGH